MNKNLLAKLEQIKFLAEESIVEIKAGLTIKAVSKKKQVAIPSIRENATFNFNLNERAFFKNYGKNMSGQKRFVLVLARIAHGDEKVIKKWDEIKNAWNKNFVFLGGKKLETRVYGTRAKESGWVNSPKDGFYQLTNTWKEIF